MSKVIVLGSSNAIPTAHAENTHLVIACEERVVLVDCVSNPVVRLEQAGMDLNDLTDIIITHFHPDHVSGLPLLLMDMWLMGRRKPLNIYGLVYTVERIERLMGFYNWTDWPDFFPVTFHRLGSVELTEVLDSTELRILASPVHHLIPTIGLRVEFKKSNRVLAYSCDTEPCDEVVRFSQKADVLIHEAAGTSLGHSSAKQAGEIAKKAKVRKLYLIHYPTGKFAKGNLIEEAHTSFSGEVALARDFMTLDFSKRIPLSHFGRGVKTQIKAGKGSKKPVEP